MPLSITFLLLRAPKLRFVKQAAVQGSPCSVVHFPAAGHCHPHPHLPELGHHSLVKPTAALSVHAGQQHPNNTAGNKHIESSAQASCLHLVGQGIVKLLSGGITPCKVQLQTENTLLAVLEICRCYRASQSPFGDLKRIT